MIRQIRPACDHFLRGRPTGPKRLSADLCLAFPRKALPANADAIFDCAASAEAELKFPLRRVDGDRPRPLSGWIDHSSARGLAEIDLVVKTLRRGISGVGIAGHSGSAPGPNRSPRRTAEVILGAKAAAVCRIGLQPIRIIR